MEELERMLALFPEGECQNINSAFRKLHANLMFRAERAVVSISGGADSDMMLDMIQALEPEKNYPSDVIRYAWFDTGIEYTATKRHRLPGREIWNHHRADKGESACAVGMQGIWTAIHIKTDKPVHREATGTRVQVGK